MRRNIFRNRLGCIILCCVGLAAGHGCVKLPRHAATNGPQATRAAASDESTRPVSINEASREELEKLPGIGPAIAARIIEHRERYGRFRRAEHLLMVRGISERRFLQLRPYVTAEDGPRAPQE